MEFVPQKQSQNALFFTPSVSTPAAILLRQLCSESNYEAVLPIPILSQPEKVVCRWLVAPVTAKRLFTAE